MSAAALIFAVFAVLLLLSIAFENFIWRWYVRICGGAPIRSNHRRAHTRRNTWR